MRSNSDPQSADWRGPQNFCGTTLVFDSGRALWQWLVSSNPIVERMLAGLAISADERAAIGRALEALVRERAGGAATARLNNSVNIGLGTK